MRRLKYLSIALLVLVSCARNTTPTAYPNPVTATFTLPPVTSTATLTPPPITSTATFAKSWKVITATPISTSDPNFLSGDLATIAKNDVLNYPDEELFRVLISQWLEKHKTGVYPSNPIKDYRVDKIFIDQASELKTVAFVEISIQSVAYSIDWTTITIKLSDSNDPWEHVGGLFTIYKEGDYIILRWQMI